MVQLQIQLVRVVFSVAEFTAVAGRDKHDFHAVFLVERQNIVVRDSKRIAAPGIDDHMHVHPADALEGSDEKGVLIEPFPWFTAVHMPFFELRVLLFDEGGPFCAEFDRLFGLACFDRQPAIVSASEPSRSRIFWMVTKPP